MHLKKTTKRDVIALILNSTDLNFGNKNEANSANHTIKMDESSNHASEK